jgi:TRAP-type C4-dicarboxylate transport system permease small subunit
MADPRPNPDPRGDNDRGTPRWAKVLAIVIVVLLLLFAIMHITGGGIRDHTNVGLTSSLAACGAPS